MKISLIVIATVCLATSFMFSIGSALPQGALRSTWHATEDDLRGQEAALGRTSVIFPTSDPMQRTQHGMKPIAMVD